MIHPGILQSDGIQHAGRGFRYSVGRVTQAWRKGGTLQADCAHVAVGKALDPCVFFAEADTPGQQHQRCCQGQAAEFCRKRLLIGVGQFCHCGLSKKSC